MSDLPSRDQRKPFSDGRRATLPHLQCGVTVSSSWHDPVACAFERDHEGEHSWASLPAISPLAENERLREALRAEIAKRHWKSNGERLTEADIEALEEQALAAVPEERGMSAHRCQPPTLPNAFTFPLQPDWTCGVCGRMWRDMVGGALRWWAEIRGPLAAVPEERE